MEFNHGRGIPGGIPEKFTFRRTVVAIRFQHGRGVRFNHAVNHHFHYIRVDPLVMEFLASAFNGVKIGCAKFRWVQKIRNVKPERLLPLPV